MIVTICSYNLLYNKYAEKHPVPFLPDQGQKWDSRKEQARRNIQSSRADIVCVQESSPAMQAGLEAGLGYRGYHADHRRKTEGVGVLFNPQRFNFLGVKTHFDPSNGHATVFVDLQDKTTEKVFRVASAHIQGGTDRTAGDTQLANTLTRFQNEPSCQPVDYFIFAGDLNQDQQVRAGSSSRLDQFRGYTRTDLPHETEIRKGRQLDWIFVRSTPHFRTQAERTDRLPPASDHHMALVTLLPQRSPVSPPNPGAAAAQLPPPANPRVAAPRPGAAVPPPNPGIWSAIVSMAVNLFN